MNRIAGTQEILPEYGYDWKSKVFMNPVRENTFKVLRLVDLHPHENVRVYASDGEDPNSDYEASHDGVGFSVSGGLFVPNFLKNPFPIPQGHYAYLIGDNFSEEDRKHLLEGSQQICVAGGEMTVSGSCANETYYVNLPIVPEKNGGAKYPLSFATPPP